MLFNVCVRAFENKDAIGRFLLCFATAGFLSNMCTCTLWPRVAKLNYANKSTCDAGFVSCQFKTNNTKEKFD